MYMYIHIYWFKVCCSIVVYVKNDIQPFEIINECNTTKDYEVHSYSHKCI